MRPMKITTHHIAFLQDHLSLNGAVRVSLQNAILLSERGVRTTFFTARWNQEEWRIPPQYESHIAVRLLPDAQKVLTEANLTYMSEVIQKEQITHLFITYPIARFPKELRLSTTCRLIFWLHEHPLSKWIRKRTLLKNIGRGSWSKRLEYYLLQYPKYFLLGNSLRKKSLVSLQQKILQYDYFIVLSESFKAFLLKELEITPSVLEEKVVVLPNTQELSLAPVEGKEKLMVYTGRLVLEPKQIDLLLDIWSIVAPALPDWRFEFYGSGKWASSLQKMIEQRGMQAQIQLKGFTNDLSEVYKRATFVCLTSSTEGWPLSLIEGQRYGCIPFAFDVPGAFSDIMGKNGEYGRLIPPFDLHEYACQLVALAQDEPAKKAMQKRIEEHTHLFTPERNLSLWEKLLQ